METNFWAYLAVLRRRFWVILLLLAATMAVILGRAWTTPAAYRSSAQLQALPLEPAEVTLYTRLNTVSPDSTIDLILFQFENLVRSPRIAQRTLSETNVSMSAGELVGNMTTERDASGDLVTVSVTAPNPDDAEKLLQKQVEFALQDLRESRALTAETSGKFLETELAQAEKDLEAARGAVLQFKLDNHIDSLDRELASQEQSIRDVTSARQAAELDIKRQQAVIAELDKQLADAKKALAGAKADSPDAGIASRLVQDLQSQLTDARVKMASQQAQVDATASLIADRQADLAALLTLAGHFQALADTEQQKVNGRDFLADKVREAQLKVSQSRNVGYLQVVTPPTTPRTQLPSRTVQTAVLGAVLSIVAGAVLVFVLEFLERILRNSPRPVAARRERA